MAYEHIIVETRGRTGLITLNRPKALNALSPALMQELSLALDGFEADDAIGCMVITGNDKAFAAGADIKAMQDKSYMDVYKSDFITAEWERITRCRKPPDSWCGYCDRRLSAAVMPTFSSSSTARARA